MCITEECLKKYIDKLEKGISDYMQMPVSQKSSEAVESMVEAWEKVKALKEEIYSDDFTEATAKAWTEQMQNADGTAGGHWSLEETTALGVPEGITAYCWNAVLNMIYSDYCEVAEKYGVGTIEFYTDLAKAFIFDMDGKEPKQKIANYYKFIVKQ